MQTDSEDAQPVKGKRLALIESSIGARFRAFLKPGESLSVEAEKTDEYVWGKLLLETADDSFEFELEGALLGSDQSQQKIYEHERKLEIVFEFLKRQFYEFFRTDRRETFHLDWKLYHLDEATVRFRAQTRKPRLEDRADTILETGDTPSDDDRDT